MMNPHRNRTYVQDAREQVIASLVQEEERRISIMRLLIQWSKKIVQYVREPENAPFVMDLVKSKRDGKNEEGR